MTCKPIMTYFVRIWKHLILSPHIVTKKYRDIHAIDYVAWYSAVGRGLIDENQDSQISLRPKLHGSKEMSHEQNSKNDKGGYHGWEKGKLLHGGFWRTGLVITPTLP